MVGKLVLAIGRRLVPHHMNPSIGLLSAAMTVAGFTENKSYKTGQGGSHISFVT